MTQATSGARCAIRFATGTVIALTVVLSGAIAAHAAIRGAVMAADGSAVENAQIVAYPRESSEAYTARLASGTLQRTPLGRATTDAHGAFALEVKESVVDLQFDAAGFAPAFRTVESSESGVVVALTPAATRHGTVRLDGKPLASALVVASAWNAEQYDPLPSSIAVRTDAKGGYELPDPSRWAGSIAVYSIDAAPDSSTLDPTAKKLDIDFNLSSGVTVSGSVVASNGKPAAGATVFVDGWPGAKAGDDGSFKLAHVRSDAAVISATLANERGDTKSKKSPVVIQIAPQRIVSGVVRDKARRQPLGGARVVIGSGEGWSNAASVISGTDGRFTFPYTGSSRASLWASRPGYNTTTVKESDAGARSDNEIALQREQRITGTVTDEAHHPIGGAFVSINVKDAPAFYVYGGKDFASSGTHSLPDGSFSLRVPEQFDSERLAMAGDMFQFQLVATKRSYASGRSAAIKPRDIAAGVSGISLVLPAGVELAGVVTDSENHPLADVVVGVMEEGTSGFGQYPLDMIFRRVVDAEWNRTDANGHFSIRVNPVSHSLAFSKPGFAVASLTHVAAPAAQPVAVKLTAGAKLAGRVTRSDGSAVSGATVTASRGRFDTFNATTDANGRFEIIGLQSGPYELSVGNDALLNFTQTVKAPATDLEIDVGALHHVRGRVIDATTRTSVSPAELRFGNGEVDSETHNMNFISHSVETPEATFVLDDVPPGTYSLTVNADGHAAKTQTVTVANEDAQVEIALDRGATVRGRVSDPTGAPLAGVSVEWDTDDGLATSFDRSKETDAKGEYVLEGVSAGKVELTFELDGYAKQKKSVDVAAAPLRVDVTLAKGLKLRGTVTADGAGVAKASIYASSSSGDDFKTAESDENGAFEIEGLSPAPYDVHATKTGYVAASVEKVDVASGAPLNLQLKKHEVATIFGHVTGIPADAIMKMASVESDDGGSAEGMVDAEGNYRIENAPAGRVTARVFAASTESPRMSRAKTVTVAPGSVTRVDLEFGTLTVKGRLTLNGAPVIAGNVTFTLSHGESAFSGRSDENGLYEVGGLDPGEYTVTAQSSRASYSTKYIVRGPSQFDIDMTGATLRGSVVDASTHEPIAAAAISLWAVDGAEPATSASQEMKSDTAGKFAASSIAEGRYRVLVQKEGFGQVTRDVTLVKGNAAELLLSMSPAEGIRAHVVDGRDGRNLEAIVVVRDRQKRVVADRANTQDDGSVSIPLAPGDYLLSVSSHGYGTVTMPVTAPARDLRIAVTPGGTLVIRSPRELSATLRLVLPNGDEYVRCWCNGIAEIVVKGTETKIENITPGSYTAVLVDEFGATSKSYPVVISEGQTAVLEVE